MAAGVEGVSDAEEGVSGLSHAAQRAGVLGVNDNASDQAGVGVHGRSRATGVFGESETWHGVFGTSRSTTGGHGVSGDAAVGVSGIGRSWIGVYGETHGTENGPAGVWGDGLEGGAGVKGHARAPGAMGVGGFHLATEGDGGPGVLGQSIRGRGVEGQGVVGVVGTGSQWIGVFGETNAPPEAGAAGVWGDGKATADGVKGVATGAGKAAVCGFQLGGNGPAIFGQGNPAGQFAGRVIVDGNLEVTGDVLLAGADYAESMTAVDPHLAPGTVVSVGADGRVRPCEAEYDVAVAGIVSGGGGVRPAVVLDHHSGGVPVALMGKVWCLADAGAGPIRPGDLLTTSRTQGHSQRVADASRALGAIIGKALTPLVEGRGLVRVLVATR
ncbi:hypothetical protein [Microbacterium sp. BK668]|uniref:hypothetical protein n=1 Tax=Microbacterium sp. BK668 TaxID=2512118 RepID=UPI00105B4A0C|nr:hypothetical protein [Microbacterium sp. BK668]TDN88651.1 hypothetical protein EV279_3096 [Microbacterium sp. BK668]